MKKRRQRTYIRIVSYTKNRMDKPFFSLLMRFFFCKKYVLMSI